MTQRWRAREHISGRDRRVTRVDPAKCLAHQRNGYSTGASGAPIENHCGPEMTGTGYDSDNPRVVRSVIWSQRSAIVYHHHSSWLHVFAIRDVEVLRTVCARKADVALVHEATRLVIQKQVPVVDNEAAVRGPPRGGLHPSLRPGPLFTTTVPLKTPPKVPPWANRATSLSENAVTP